MKILLLLISFIILKNAELINAQDEVGDSNYPIVLKTTAANLYLRSEPTVKSNPIKKLKLGTELLWTNIKSSNKDIVEWNGSKVVGYWYKVYFNINIGLDDVYMFSDSTAWVFGKGIDLGLVCFYELKDKSLSTLNNEWIKVEYATKKEFNSISRVDPYWIPNRKIIINDDNFSEIIGTPDYSLKFLNGKSLTVTNDTEYTSETHFYIGEFKKLGFYITSYAACCEYYSAIRKSDGKEFGIEYLIPFKKIEKGISKYYPIIAQDNHTLLCSNTCEPGGMKDIFWLYLDKNKITQVFRYKGLSQHDFKFISPTSGIVQVRNYNSDKFTEKFIKITLK